MTFILYPAFALLSLLLGGTSLRQVIPAQPPTGQQTERFFLPLLPFFTLATVLFAVMFMSTTQLAFLLQEDGIQDSAAF
jgi:hypothetical protein